MHIDDDEFIELVKNKKTLKGYVIFKCCRVTYDIEKDEFIADKTKNIFVNFLWIIVDVFSFLWSGNVTLLEDEKEN